MAQLRHATWREGLPGGSTATQHIVDSLTSLQRMRFEFFGLSAPELSTVAARCLLVRAKPYEPLLVKGELASFVGIVLEGSADTAVYQAVQNGNYERHVLSEYQPGSIVGAATAFHVGVRAANVSAGKEGCVLAVLLHEQLEVRMGQR
jgi:CRP-like cAMP-binding protein